MTQPQLPNGHLSSWPSELSPQRIIWHEWPVTPFSGLCEVLNLKQWIQQVTQSVFQGLPFADEYRQLLPAFSKISYNTFHIGVGADLSNKTFYLGSYDRHDA
jgi:hypothetical protein